MNIGTGTIIPFMAPINITVLSSPDSDNMVRVEYTLNFPVSEYVDIDILRALENGKEG